MKAPLAIVTMVYNEAVFLPVWLRHYGAQAGTANCFVVDHGSDDGSTVAVQAAGASVIRIPRSPQDDAVRCGFVSDLCAGLLAWYEAVIHVDVDELLVCDPQAAPSLSAFAAGQATDTVVTAIGVDVVHVPGQEPDLDWSRPVGGQRRWLRFSSAMCKPVLVRRRVAWAPGFHCIDAAPVFGRLFLFHLRYADLASGLARLARTRAQPWITPEAGSHQRMSDAGWEGMLRGMAGLPQDFERSLEPSDPELGRMLAAVMESVASRVHDQYRIDLHLSGDRLWRLPERFVGLF